MTELETEDQKLPVIQVVFKNLQQSVKMEEDLLKQVEHMDKLGLSSSKEYKILKLRQFEESFFALFLLRLTRDLSNKKSNQTYTDCIRAFKSKMGIWRKDDRKRMRKDFSKTEYVKKILYRSIDKSFEKSEKYISFLQQEIENAENNNE